MYSTCKKSEKEVRKPIIEICTNQIKAIPIDVKPGKNFGHLVLATAWLKDGRMYDILFDANGELITEHEKIGALEMFLEKTFIPALLDGQPCLINVVNNATDKKTETKKIEAAYC